MCFHIYRNAQRRAAVVETGLKTSLVLTHLVTFFPYVSFYCFYPRAVNTDVRYVNLLNLHSVYSTEIRSSISHCRLYETKKQQEKH